MVASFEPRSARPIPLSRGSKLADPNGSESAEASDRVSHRLPLVSAAYHHVQQIAAAAPLQQVFEPGPSPTNKLGSVDIQVGTLGMVAAWSRAPMHRGIPEQRFQGTEIGMEALTGTWMCWVSSCQVCGCLHGSLFISICGSSWVAKVLSILSSSGVYGTEPEAFFDAY